MGGSTFLIGALLIVIVATIACPVAAGLHAETIRSHYWQFRCVPIWCVLVAAWIILAMQIKTDPSLAWFRDETGEGLPWFAAVNISGIFVSIIAAIDGFFMPLEKYRSER